MKTEITLTIRFANKEDLDEWVEDMNGLLSLSTDKKFEGYGVTRFDSIDVKREKERYKLIRKGGE